MFDLLIQNGTVIDGSGKDGFIADVAVENGKIVAVGNISGDAKQIIDATGLVVTPGFIDSHSHADGAILTYPEQLEKVEQGITTSIGGQCGSTAYPQIGEGGSLIKMSTFLQKAVTVPQGANIATFAGHRALRKAVMGMAVRAATAEEITKMQALLRDAMDAGAMGVSFGLIYSPSCYAETEELIALARVAKEKGGMISAHIRSESDHLVEAAAAITAHSTNKNCAFCSGVSPGSSKFFPVSVESDQLLCLPLPFTLANGFSCNKQTKPCLPAILFISSMVIWFWSDAKFDAI